MLPFATHPDATYTPSTPLALPTKGRPRSAMGKKQACSAFTSEPCCFVNTGDRACARLWILAMAFGSGLTSAAVGGRGSLSSPPQLPSAYV